MNPAPGLIRYTAFPAIHGGAFLASDAFGIGPAGTEIRLEVSLLVRDLMGTIEDDILYGSAFSP